MLSDKSFLLFLEKKYFNHNCGVYSMLLQEVIENYASPVAERQLRFITVS